MKYLKLAVAPCLLVALAACEQDLGPQPQLEAQAVILNSDGIGFVGKGDAQTAFSWSNKQMQTNHTSISFRYVATATYELDCEWTTGPDHNRKTHTNTKEAKTSVNATIASESRKTGQWTGWHLTGYSGGAANPVAEPTDADCGAEGNDMKTVVDGSIELLSENGGLYAVYTNTTVTPNTTDARLLIQ